MKKLPLEGIRVATISVVWAGPFATPQEAEKARKSLKTAYKISPQKREYEEPVPK